MSRRRRLAIVTAAVVASLTGSVAGASALPSGGHHIQSSGANDHGDWWCVAVQGPDIGYCQTDPLPDRLPLP
ncbi:MAG: hypothetical protein QOK43_2373 [Acidimicrobiaceae bacterium]|nr:hypothetical protein [Acidimicrobiaceae bacterium]